MKKIQLLALSLLGAIVLGTGLTGCASMGAHNTESLLSASGFTIRTPQNPQQQQAYDNLKPYKMETGIINGKRLYGYKDEKKGVVYVGGEAQYQAYKRLSVEQNIAADNMAAAQMNTMTIQRYSAFGPNRYW